MRYIRPQYPYNVLFTLVIAFFLLFVTQYLYKRVNTDKRVSSFQKTFLEKEKLTEDVLQNVIDQLKDKGLENLLSDEEWVASTDALFEKSGHVVFFYDTDSLIYLSNNVLPVNNNNLPRYNFGIEYIENGWYLLKKRKFEELDVWIAFLIKESYNYHNRYLKNQFNSSFQLTNNVEISINSAVGEMIFFNNGDYAMSLIIDDAVPISRGKMVYIVLLTLINIFIIFLVVYLFYYYLIIQKDKWNSLFRITLFFIALTGIRALLFYLKIPEIFYESVLFSPRYYATSKYLPSLGDLFLHVIFLNVFLNFTYNTLKTTQLANRSAKSSVVLTLILILSLYAFFALLIIDSI